MAQNSKQALALLIALIVCGCTTTSDKSGLARHYQFSDEMQAIMSRMDKLVHDRQLTGSEVDSLRARQGEIVQQIAHQLTEESNDLIKGEGGTRLTPLEEAQFRAIADHLRLSAERFSHFSRYGTETEVEQAFKEMTSVCNSCHQLYRDNQ